MSLNVKEELEKKQPAASDTREKEIGKTWLGKTTNEDCVTTHMREPGSILYESLARYAAHIRAHVCYLSKKLTAESIQLARERVRVRVRESRE